MGRHGPRRRPHRCSWPHSSPTASPPSPASKKFANGASWSAWSWRPPRPGLRWGRRVCAGAVARGVLLRPLGDVVVIMPPLTTTDEEIVRIIEALEGALHEVTGP